MINKIDKDDGMKIVVIGGGNGASSILRGLKQYTNNITAIITVADDGGSSGLLRNDYGILPPGDIRNCIMALADTEPSMEKLMQYRFKEGAFKDQNFGNLLLMAMNDIYGGFVKGIREVSSVLAVSGTVLPVTLEDVVLCAKLEDGTIIEGESKIPIEQSKAKVKIKNMFLKPENCQALPEALVAIADADVIILGPGSLYTSIIPNLLVHGIPEALMKTEAPVVYASNIMTQKGETINYKLSDHLNAINDYIGKSVIKYVIANNGRISDATLDKYLDVGESPVCVDGETIACEGMELICEDIVKIVNGFVRHDEKKFTQVICDLPITRIWR